MRPARSHWVWLAVTLTVLSALDYWNHIARPGSAFAADPVAWFGFTYASLASLLVIARGTSWLVERFTGLGELTASTTGIMNAICAHLVVTGPLWDRVFWHGGLIFDQVALPVLIAAVLYLFYRAGFGFIVHMLRTPPRSLP